MTHQSASLFGAVALICCATTIQANEADPLPGYSTLDVQLCVSDRERVERVFAERFPHEACSPLSNCDPRLVTSAEVIATRQCRQGAIAACVAVGGSSNCLKELEARWTESTAKTDEKLNWLLGQVDLSAMPPLVARRIERHQSNELPASCYSPAIIDDVLGTKVPQDASCGLYQALSGLEATETIARILSRPFE